MLATYLLAYLLYIAYMQASGAEFDMVMSTKEQGAFETALVTPASLDLIKAGLSKVDVRQVWMLPWIPGCIYSCSSSRLPGP